MGAGAGKLVHGFFDAFEAGDLERMVALFGSEARYDDLFYGSSRGTAELRGLFGRMLDERGSCRWSLRDVTAVPGRAIAEWTFVMAPPASVREGRHVTFPGVSVFDVGDGQCLHYREYFDRAAALLAAGVNPAVVERLVARTSNVAVVSPDPGLR